MTSIASFFGSGNSTDTTYKDYEKLQTIDSDDENDDEGFLGNIKDGLEDLFNFIDGTAPKKPKETTITKKETKKETNESPPKSPKKQTRKRQNSFRSTCSATTATTTTTTSSSALSSSPIKDDKPLLITTTTKSKSKKQHHQKKKRKTKKAQNVQDAVIALDEARANIVRMEDEMIFWKIWNKTAEQPQNDDDNNDDDSTSSLDLELDDIIFKKVEEQQAEINIQQMADDMFYWKIQKETDNMMQEYDSDDSSIDLELDLLESENDKDGAYDPELHQSKIEMMFEKSLFNLVSDDEDDDSETKKHNDDDDLDDDYSIHNEMKAVEQERDATWALIPDWY